MLGKRSRTVYETHRDDRITEVSFVLYGCPPSAEGFSPSDDSFIPPHKQGVRDDRGRKRLHGAFTGGWSAGYFNTVGSETGWAPAGFVSSRACRRRDDSTRPSQHPEDYMDEEDLKDRADSQSIHTARGFAGLGKEPDSQFRDSVIDMLRTKGETMGSRLLKRMGWKEGQGTGPKISRPARTRDKPNGNRDLPGGRICLFAPPDITLVAESRKRDRRGLGSAMREGNDPTCGLDRSGPVPKSNMRRTGAEPARSISLLPRLGAPGTTITQPLRSQCGRGDGIIDNSDEDDDLYTIGPKILSYKRAHPITTSKQRADGHSPARQNLGSIAMACGRRFRRIDATNASRTSPDGHAILETFLLSQTTELNKPFTPTNAVPCVPPHWTPGRRTPTDLYPFLDLSTRTGAQDPISRAHVLGEPSLAGKPAFDYMGGATRNKLALTIGNRKFPPAHGDHSADEPMAQLDANTAAAALAKLRGDMSPYGSDRMKRIRYKQYLDFCAGLASTSPQRPDAMSGIDFSSELQEFYDCARIFRPMSGFMASRFTTSKAIESDVQMGTPGTQLSPAHDTAAEAAKKGMFGIVTRSCINFRPSRILSKRFNVSLAHDLSVTCSGKAREPAFRMAEQIPDPRLHSYTRSVANINRPPTSAPKDGIVNLRLVKNSECRVAEAVSRPPDHIFQAIFGEDDN